MGFLDAVRSIPTVTRLLKEVVTTKGWEELRAGIQTVGGTGPGTLAPTVQTFQALKKYRGWVYPAVNRIAQKVSTVPFYLYKENSKQSREEFKRHLDHPVIKLLQAPNDFLGGRQLIEIIYLHLELCGFACVKIIRNGAGQPKQLFPYYPQELIQIELGTSTDNIIKAFHFAPIQNRHKVERIPYKDMLYFHFPHPENPYMPCTPIQALAHVTDIDLFLQVYTKSFFQNGARPDFVIIPDKQIGKEAAERVSEGWMARFRGPGKNFKPAVLSDSVKIQQLSMSARDFEFLAMSNWTQDNILAAYGVPKAVLGLMGDSNRAASLNAQTVFVENCISRRLHLFEDVINRQLLTQYRNLEQYVFEFANAIPRDDEWEQAKNQQQLSTGITAVNEIRRRDGVEPWPSKLMDVPWVGGQPVPGCDPEADKLWKEFTAPPQMPGMPGQMPPGAEGMPPEMSNAPEAQGVHGAEGGRPEGTSLGTMVRETLRSSRPNLAMLLNASRGKRGGLAALMQSHPETASLGQLLIPERRDLSLSKLLVKEIRDYLADEYFETDEEKVVFKEYEEVYEALEPLYSDYEAKSSDFYVQKGAEISQIVKKSFSNFVTKGTEWDIDEDNLRESYMQQTAPFVTKAVDIGFKAGYRLVEKAGGDVEEPDAFTEASLAAAGKMLHYSSDLKVKSTKKVLVQILKEALDKGYDAERTGEMIEARFKEIGGQRAQLIAVTELAAATDAGVTASFEKINSDAGKVVIKESKLSVSLDERVCKQCNGERNHTVMNYETGERFIQIPIHPRCRCVQVPVLKGESNA